MTNLILFHFLIDYLLRERNLNNDQPVNFVLEQIHFVDYFAIEAHTETQSGRYETNQQYTVFSQQIGVLIEKPTY